MTFDKVLNEVAPAGATGMADVVGTDTPHMVDWASGKGPQTDLGKLAKKKKKKDKLVRRILNNPAKMN